MQQYICYPVELLIFCYWRNYFAKIKGQRVSTSDRVTIVLYYYYDDEHDEVKPDYGHCFSKKE
jgi:hypothetical protein